MTHDGKEFVEMKHSKPAFASLPGKPLISACGPFQSSAKVAVCDQIKCYSFGLTGHASLPGGDERRRRRAA